MNVPYVNLKEQHKPLKKQLLKALEGVLDRGDFILGEDVSKFEEEFAAYCGVKYAVGVNSGTDALYLALLALGVKAGDEVITTSNSFIASATSIASIGAVPVFVDITKEGNMDPVSFEKAITKRTKAVMPVHLTGRIADMKAISAIAKKHKLFVVEDSAQAVGAHYRGKRAGALSDCGAFSLHPLKTLNACGDAGVITTNSQKLYTKLRTLRAIGLKDRIHSDEWGFNSRLDTVQAAFLRIKLPYVDSWVDARRKNADLYRAALSGLEKYLQVPIEEPHEKHAYHVFVIQADKRDKLQQFLTERGIETKIHYPIPIHLQVAAKGLGYKKGSFPETERQAARILSLPIYQGLTKQQINYVANTIREFYGA